MTRPITNKDDLELLIDELGLKTVLAIIATICQEKADKAKVLKGYYSDPCKQEPTLEQYLGVLSADF
ncbi:MULTISPECIES: hypothetical protein [unclassified Coleofasciculus]|uniref:hypothetical protein n=1 Tax=unclassified Coleofasciculus TaxID=2692782 RepID=UPI00187F938F|nr:MULTISPECIES: hypothetical protein [unclassified Coleofasciculus]MBE9129496.1 hypothetical protein [Coleofasciculus sp. LEGE 07081]MBE9152090.1 hypothetical protein [Coleofasciculus sp. LEGE 07092]